MHHPIFKSLVLSDFYATALNHVHQIAQKRDIDGAPLRRRVFFNVGAKDDMRYVFQIA
jgi:hypothetical protein